MVRYTQIFVTINSNHAPKTKQEETFLVNKFRTFLTYDLAQHENWRTLLNVDFSTVTHISLQAVGIEIGKIKRRVHAHFVVLIEHNGNVSWKHTQKHWQALLRAKLPIKGAYAQVQLLNSRPLNYTAKTTRKKGGAIRSLGVQQTKVFS